MAEILSKLCANLGMRDYIFGAGVLATIYAFHGVQSQIFCEVLLGAIPAAFTYKVLLFKEATREGHMSLLFFWVLHGLFSSSVHLITPTSSFFFLKFATLGIFLFHAISQNKAVLMALRVSFPLPDDSLHLMKQPAKSIFVDTTECTQMPTKHQADVPQPILNESMITASTAYDFTTNSHQQGADHQQSSFQHYVSSIQAVHNNYALTPPPIFWSYNNHQPVLAERASASVRNLRPIVDESPCDEQKILVQTNDWTLKTDDCGRKVVDRMAQKLVNELNINSLHTQHFFSGDISHQDRSCTIPLGYGDSDTCIATMITFKGRSVGAQANIFVINTSHQNIMWALKTNAFDRLQASPTCGMIPNGQTIEIKLAISKSCDGIVSGSDKLAIDYTFVPSSISHFDKGNFKKTCRRRHLMRVTFDD